jgi:hypothetical protein
MKMRHLIAISWLALASPAVASQGSGCMPATGTVSGLSFSQLVTQGFAALISGNSGASAPATDCSGAAVKGQFWVDTSVTPNLLKQYNGASWIILGAIDSANNLWSPPVGGGVATVTAATTTDICAAPSAVQNISGTTTITGFGSGCVVGLRKTLLFNSATPLTYNATSLILPGQSSYTSAAGDVADAVYLGSGNWRVVSITKIDGSSVTNPASPLGTVLYGTYGTIPVKSVYGYGQALARASYPGYLAAVTRAQSATLTAGNNTITSVGNTAGLGAGMPLEGTGIQSGTVISSVTSSTVVMSKTASANGSQTVTAFITGYGSGGDSTTVGVLDCRGRAMAGRDDMGGTAASLLTSTYFGGNSAMVGSVGGGESKALLTANLPPYTPAGSVTYSGTTQVRNIGLNVTGGSSVFVLQDQVTGTGSLVNEAVINLTGPALTGTAQGGTSTPVRTVQPTMIAECVVVVLP